MVSLRKLCRKMKKQKKRLLLYSSPTVHIAQYHIDPYSLNFADGYRSSDPVNASRSFPAPFAILDSKVYFDKSWQVSSDDDNCSEMSS